MWKRQKNRIICSKSGENMSDIKKLIELILSDNKLRSSKSFQNNVYRDEPIIRTASQMKNYVPDEIRSMKAIASERRAYYHTKEYIFYRQAKFMEQFEDDYDFQGDFFCYYPTYQDMNNNQLRGYFSWRTKVRKGNLQKTSLSFVFVYIYELLNLIGADSPEDGFEKLNNFCRIYGKIDPHILNYTKNWMIDFAVYYDLDKALIDDITDSDFCIRLSVLQNYGSHDNDELFDAVCGFSSYNIRNSKLYKNCSDDVKIVVCDVFRQLSDYYVKNRKKSLCEKLFGVKIQNYYNIFQAAVFYDNKKYTDYTYEINDSFKFTCKDGRWFCEKYYGSHGKNKWLGDVLRSVDSIMRQKTDFGSPINLHCDTKWVLNIINKAIDGYIESKNKNAAPKIEIDISKLAGIRKSADITRDKLITEEEREDIAEISEIIEQVNNAPENDTPLDDNEYAFMRSLLYGESFEGKAMLSVLADSINEKLFDMFGDIVIIFEGDSPEVIEDYIEELKGIIK